MIIGYIIGFILGYALCWQLFRFKIQDLEAELDDCKIKKGAN